MGSRLELQEHLELLIGSDQVYFQPPPNVQMQYPAIVYELSDMVSVFASNRPYRTTNQYEITVIDKNPDSLLPAKIKALPMSRFVRAFKTSGLNHTIFDLYF